MENEFYVRYVKLLPNHTYYVLDKYKIYRARELGKYIYKVARDKEGKVIICIKTVIVDDNVDVIMYGYKGKDYSGKNKENAEEFFSKIYRTY